jgi:moderate conductance mechanosensitive channel
MTNLPPTAVLARMNDTFMSRVYSHLTGHESSTGRRIILILALAVFLHVMVKIIRSISEWIINKSHAQRNPLGFVTQQPKFVTLIQLVGNTVTSIMYFFAMGLVLQEFGVNLTAYLASASIVGLAISFGSQGMVQDMVIGLTLIFSDAMDVGDMVEVDGAVVVIGRVDEIGLRFTKLINFYNQKVFIPNRTIANVSRFPNGGIYAYADVLIPPGAAPEKAIAIVDNVARGMWRQFGAIILSEPMVGEVETAEGGGWDFIRVQFKIWPGQGTLIETTFRQQMVSAMKTFHANYADWQVPVTYRAMTAPKTSKPPPEPTPDKPAH